MTYYTRGYNPQPTQRVGSAELKAEFQLIADGLNAAEAQDGKAIRAEDAIPALSNAISRASKLLSFDENGKPVTLIAKADIDDAVALAQQKAADATSSADNAAAAATAAAQRLADIEALYDQFDDRYLGVKATDPTVDNDGNALQAGALYINSASGFIRVYTGSAWVQGISATAGVTSVNGQQGALVLPTFNGVPLLGNAGNIVTETQNVLYETRSSNTALAPADKGKLINLTGGNWTQTLQAAATLGAGWYCYLRNLGGLTALPDTWNGSFSTDTLWTKEAGWTITGGQAVASNAVFTTLTSTSSPIVIGRKYRVTYTVSNYSSGSVQVRVGNTYDTYRNANGTYTFTLVAANTVLSIYGSSATLRIDNILIDEIDASVTLDPNGSELIDGIASGPIRAGMTLLVVCTGTAFECVRVGPHTAIEVKTSGVTWQPPLGVRAARATLIGGGVVGSSGYAGIVGSSFTCQINVTPAATYTISIGASAPYGSPSGQTTLEINSLLLASNSGYTAPAFGVQCSNSMTGVSGTSPVLGLWSGSNYGWSTASSAASGAIIFEY